MFSCFTVFYMNASKVLLIATASQRLLLLSRREEAQLNLPYEKAKLENGK